MFDSIIQKARSGVTQIHKLGEVANNTGESHRYFTAFAALMECSGKIGWVHAKVGQNMSGSLLYDIFLVYTILCQYLQYLASNQTNVF